MASCFETESVKKRRFDVNDMVQVKASEFTACNAVTLARGIGLTHFNKLPLETEIYGAR